MGLTGSRCRDFRGFGVGLGGFRVRVWGFWGLGFRTLIGDRIRGNPSIRSLSREP